MLKGLLVLFIVVRITISILHTAFVSLSRVELRQIAEKYPSLASPLERGARFQLTISLTAELLLLAVFGLWVVISGAYIEPFNVLNAVLVPVIYLIVEKVFVSTTAFLNREWVLSRFFVLFLPFYYIFLLLVFPASLIARHLMKMEDEREEDEDERESEEKELIQGVLDFGDTLVREIMTPRTDIVGVEQSISYQKLISLFCSAKHSRMPVYRHTVDDIIGVVHLKDVVAAKSETFTLSGFLQKPFYVPETKKVDELLRDMQKARTKMTVVLDEYGGTAGIVTIEDLMEEIVGEIEDEHDSHYEEIQQLEKDSFLVDGKCNLEDLEEETGINLEVDEIDTVGGAVFSIFGRIPEEGDSLEWRKYRLTV
ncbi:MAG: HlyC/CorC family transporter, partial [Acidobacteria bacterium]|nr:HlyC/CorC family transporter [Acidobacteriota bacterium]